jgi:CubicO group peptidase (beta-lactamase class C family)
LPQSAQAAGTEMRLQPNSTEPFLTRDDPHRNKSNNTQPPSSMKKMHCHLAFALLAFLLLPSCREDRVEINTVADFELFVAEEMESQRIPALSALIFKEENILYEHYFGYANIQQQLALADDHLFLLASISKVVTATALLQLHEAGHFGLDDPINDYLPFAVNIPGYSKGVTFRMLLTHTSAIADNDPVLDGQYYYGQDPPVSLSFFITNYLASGGAFYDADENFYDFEPGTEYEYSNIGSALIGLLVEEVSGMDFNTYCQQRIFAPLGMEHTAWRLDEIAQTIVTPYDYRAGQNRPIPHYTNADYPNGGLRSTARDMFKLLSALALGGQAGNYRLLSQATVNAMMTPQIPAIDDEVGLHFFLMDHQNNLWGHDGGEQGVATIMAFNPATKTGALIFANQGEADLDEILAAAYELGQKL